MQATWWDQRQELIDSDLEECIGVLWNVASESLMGRVFRGRHWIALLQQGDKWMNLDSNLDRPIEIGSCGILLRLLNSKRDETHILLVKRQVPS